MHYEYDFNLQQPANNPLAPGPGLIQTPPLASYWQRLVAAAIDLAIFLGFWFGGTGLYHYFMNKLVERNGPNGDLRNITSEQLLYILIFGLLIFAGYGVYFVFTFGGGQTSGCKIAGQRLVSLAARKPNKMLVLLRYISYLTSYGLLFYSGYLGVVEPFFVKLLNGDRYYGLLDKPPIIVGVLLAGLVWLIPQLTMFFNRDRQSLYDRAFNVFVVKAR